MRHRRRVVHLQCVMDPVVDLLGAPVSILYPRATDAAEKEKLMTKNVLDFFGQ